MWRSTLIPSAIICAGFTFAAVGQTLSPQPATPAVHESVSQPNLARIVKILEERVANIEQRLKMKEAQTEPERSLIPFGTVTSNLNEAALNRYLRLSMSIEVDSQHQQAATAAVEKLRPQIQDWALSFLAEKTLEDIRGRAGMNKLRQGIQEGINAQFKSARLPEFAKAIVFDEMNVQ